MEVKIQSPHFKASKLLVDWVKRKVTALDKFGPRIQRADVKLVSKQKGKKILQGCNLLLHIKGNDIFTKAKTDSLEKSVTLSVDAAKRKLRKRKTRNMILGLKQNRFKTA